MAPEEIRRSMYHVIQGPFIIYLGTSNKNELYWKE